MPQLVAQQKDLYKSNKEDYQKHWSLWMQNKAQHNLCHGTI